MSDRDSSSPVSWDRRPGASGVDHVPLADAGWLGPTAAVLVEALISSCSVGLAFALILFVPFRAAWREREARLRSVLRERAELEADLTNVFGKMGIALAFLDAEGRPIRTNAAFGALVGTEAVRARTRIHEVLGVPELADLVGSVASGGVVGPQVLRTGIAFGRRTLNVGLTTSRRSADDPGGVFISIDDETARWAQADELSKSEEFYSAVTDESRDLILRLAPDGRVLLANAAARSMLELLGSRAVGSLLPDSGASSETVLAVRARRATMSPSQPRVAQSATVVLGDGRRRRLEWSELGFFDRDGVLTEIHVVGRDVTELAETRLRLEESEARYRSLFRRSQAMLVVVDPATGLCVDANPRTTELTGRRADEVVGQPASCLFRSEDRDRIEALVRTDPSEVLPPGVEAWLSPCSGEDLPVEVSPSPLTDWDQRPLIYLAIRDTSRRKAEEARRAAREAELRALFHAVPIGIGLFRDRICLEANEGFCAITGYSSDELIGRSSRMLYPSDEEFEETGRRLYSLSSISRGVGGSTVRFRRKDGRVIQVLLTAAPFDPADPSKGAAVAALDVTEKLALEAEMRKNDVLLRLFSGHAPAILWTTDEALRVTSALGAPIAGDGGSGGAGLAIERLFGSASAAGEARERHEDALRSGAAAFEFDREGKSFAASIETLPGPDGRAVGTVGVAVDTTARKVAEGKLQERQRQLQFLLSIARLALGQVETRELLAEIADRIRDEFGVSLAAIGLLDRRGERTVLAGVSGTEPSPGAGGEARPRALLDETLAGEVVRSGRAIVRGRDEIGGRIVDAGLQGFDPLSYAGVPLRAGSQVIGVVGLAGCAPLDLSDGSLAWLESVADFVALVVERRLAAEEVLRLSRAVEQSQIAVVILDPVGRIVYANPFFYRATEYRPEDAVGRDTRFLEAPEQLPETYDSVRTEMMAGRQWTGELPVRVADGRTRWWNLVYSPVLDGAGRTTNVVIVAEDVTERKAAQDELRRSREKLRSLWGRLATLQEEERRNLAHELNEGIGQTLAGIAYGMAWAGRRLPPGGEEIGSELTRLGAEASGAIEALRALTRSLRPATVDLDAVAALETEVSAFRRRMGIPCRFSAVPESFALESDISLVLLRVCQEALRSAALHGDPDEVSVLLERAEGVVRLVVLDDGGGPGDAERGSALGLGEAQERLIGVGGALHIERNDPRGTRLVAEIPICARDNRRRS